jgi:hypothetical protein
MFATSVFPTKLNFNSVYNFFEQNVVIMSLLEILV